MLLMVELLCVGVCEGSRWCVIVVCLCPQSGLSVMSGLLPCSPFCLPYVLHAVCWHACLLWCLCMFPVPLPMDFFVCVALSLANMHCALLPLHCLGVSVFAMLSAWLFFLCLGIVHCAKVLCMPCLHGCHAVVLCWLLWMFLSTTHPCWPPMFLSCLQACWLVVGGCTFIFHVPSWLWRLRDFE